LRDSCFTQYQYKKAADNKIMIGWQDDDYSKWLCRLPLAACSFILALAAFASARAAWLTYMQSLAGAFVVLVQSGRTPVSVSST
jgi:hypothetical protein